MSVTNDTSEEAARKREIYETLRGALASARRDGGIDRPVEWARLGLLDLALYVPYAYDVLRNNITTYFSAPSDL